jgi:3-oxoacyl-[acyl-carrier protein] reductase
LSADLGLNLRGRVALVSGGSRGIGRALVECLAEAGVDVCVNYARDERAAAEAVRAAEEKGVRAFAHRADVASVRETEELVGAVLKRFGRMDFLICNAGVWEGAAVEELSEELWERVLEINLKGTFALCRAAVPALKRQKFGRIVVVSSTAGQRGEAFVSNYAASKGGQISFAKSLAAELAPHGITVNAVAPGWVLTEMTAEVFSDAEFRREVERAVPLGRVAAPEDVARPILFLCSEWARHITGEVLNINGGSVLCG